MGYGAEILIKFINQRHAGRNVDSYDLIFAQVVKIFDECPERIPVRCDDHPFPGEHILFYHFFKVRDDTLNRRFETFMQRQECRIHGFL